MTSTTSRLCAAGLAVAIVLGTAAAANADHRRYRHNNDGAAAAALLGGLVIGGIIANSAAPPPAYGYSYPQSYSQPYPASNPHADWCAANTPGYNAYDNTYQGYYAGERVPCRSPYGG
jgi:hypothetical protein